MELYLYGLAAIYVVFLFVGVCLFLFNANQK